MEPRMSLVYSCPLNGIKCLSGGTCRSWFLTNKGLGQEFKEGAQARLHGG